MIDKIIGATSIAAFAVFVGYIALKIMEPPLIAIVVVVIVMGAYDFYKELKANDAKG